MYSLYIFLKSHWTHWPTYSEIYLWVIQLGLWTGQTRARSFQKYCRICPKKLSDTNKMAILHHIKKIPSGVLSERWNVFLSFFSNQFCRLSKISMIVYISPGKISVPKSTLMGWDHQASFSCLYLSLFCEWSESFHVNSLLFV